MRKILDEIQSGGFAKEWILENQAGRRFNAAPAGGRAPDRGGRGAAAGDDAVDARRPRGLVDRRVLDQGVLDLDRSRCSRRRG